MRLVSKSIIAAALALSPLVSHDTQAALFVASQTAPVVDGADIAMLNQTGAVNSGKLFTDTAVLGQSFTTGSNPQGYLLDAVTLQVGDASGTASIVPGTKVYNFRVGTLSGTAFSPVATETATQTVTLVDMDYITLLLANPVLLAPNTLYNFDVGMASTTTPWQQGIPYLRNSANNNTAFYTGGGSTSSTPFGVGSGTLALQNYDRIFHVNLTAAASAVVPEPATASLALLAAGGLMRRRRLRPVN